MSEEREVTPLANGRVEGLQALLAAAQEEIRFLHRAVQELTAENAALYRAIAGLRERTVPLAGLRIGIIGHTSREGDYREMVERLGGRLVYASAGDKLGRVDRVVQKADGSLFIPQWGNHTAWQRANDAAARYGRPLLLASSPGLAAVEKLLVQQLLPLIQLAR